MQRTVEADVTQRTAPPRAPPPAPAPPGPPRPLGPAGASPPNPASAPAPAPGGARLCHHLGVFPCLCQPPPGAMAPPPPPPSALPTSTPHQRSQAPPPRTLVGTCQYMTRVNGHSTRGRSGRRGGPRETERVGRGGGGGGEAMAGLPEGWAEFNDEAGEKYYHHAGLGLTQWERPAAPAARPVRFLGPRPRPPFHGPSPAALPLPLAVSQRGSEWCPAAALGGGGGRARQPAPREAPQGPLHRRVPWCRRRRPRRGCAGRSVVASFPIAWHVCGRRGC